MLFPNHVGWYVYLTLQAIAFLSVPWLLATAYIRSRWLTPFFALLLFTFQPTFIEQFVLLAGNVANLFYPLALATGIIGIKRNNWLPFYLVVAVAALLNPTFLDLLILPLLAGRRQMVRSLACVLSVAFVYLLQRIFMPLDFARFQRNVFTQVFIRQDAGFNIFNYLHKQGRTIHSLNNPLLHSAAHIAIVGSLLAAFYLLRSRRTLPAVHDLWLPALIVTTILSNPRLQHIDAAIAILPAIFLCVEGVRRLPSRTSSYVCIAAFFSVFSMLIVKQFEMGLLVLLYASVLLTLYLLFHAPAPPASSIPLSPLPHPPGTNRAI